MRKGSGKAKYTDTQRFNWLTKGGGTILKTDYEMWLAIAEDDTSETGPVRMNPRKAVDAAMRRESAIRASKPRPARGKAERGK